MAHYAFLDENNIVTEVITGKNEGEDDIDWEQWYGEFRGQVCKRTSYNTQGGKHILDGIPFRKNYAGIGYTYDFQRDAFIPPLQYPSWILNEDTCLWEAPFPIPTDGQYYYWDETTLSWLLFVEIPEIPITQELTIEQTETSQQIDAISTLDLPVISSSDLSAISTSDIVSLNTITIEEIPVDNSNNLTQIDSQIL
jgi:hypothetical protein